ncbi:sensor histidine kinase [Flavivirga spongiicola]|uniref:Histidine kinase n=1 Tax=Flavivirga spongiicola TaxID=421621 RepID=A0ABU7XU60_9FLAO|nr:histidine kinase [Flavivirga sp. MEBiC05379]MDO5978974.1 histidine kinase [Flavivirga sp. MEBiC05379]
MKKLCPFLFFLFIGIASFAQETEKLPIQPWKDILEMNSNAYFPITKWATNIDVKLKGTYTEADSLTIDKIVKKLDALTETISIKFSNTEDSNLELHFLDTLAKDVNNVNSTITGRYGPNTGSGYTSGEFYIYKIDKTDLEVQSSLESRLAKILVNGSFIFLKRKEKRNSVFNPLVGNNNSTTPLNQEDMSIIKEVYRKDYEDRLKTAESQFELVVENIRNERISQRKKSIWWVKNPVSVLILPALILFLAFVFVIKKINQSLVPKIEKEWLRFGVMTLIALFFADIIIVLCVSVYDFLTIPDDYRFVPVIRNDTIISTTILLVFVFPFIFLLRFIELKISKSSRQIFTKTVLIFISTGFLPFVIFLSLIYFTNGVHDSQRFYIVSQVFMYLMAIASIRAFVSYFIFKERNLIEENEKKLSNLRELKTKAELKSLQSQINPHFLYNSLNSIASLAPIDARRTQKMAYSLSDLFKYSINRKGKKVSTIKDEIDMVKTYLEIEKIRFGDRLEFIIEVNNELEGHKIPLFLIQPLVENAVKHGISQNEGKGEIALKIKKEDNKINISVSDNGPDFPEGLLSGHGLQTVYDLLRLSYKDEASLNWTNTPEKMITITIPETI